MGRESGEVHTGPKWSDMFPGGFAIDVDQNFIEKQWNKSLSHKLCLVGSLFMLAAGEHTVSTVRKVAGPTPN